MTDVAYGGQLAAWQGLDHPRCLGFGKDIAVRSPDDQGWYGEGREPRPQERARRRTARNPAFDVGRVDLPTPASVRPLAQYSERQLALILEAAPRDDRR